jgi:hypothetical protein
MSYSPSISDAIGTYMVAAANLHDVSLSAVNQPSSHFVEETQWGRFRILPDRERDEHGRFNRDVAACVYDESAEVWRVRLLDRDSESTEVVVQWDKDKGSYVVVEEADNLT